MIFILVLLTVVSAGAFAGGQAEESASTGDGGPTVVTIWNWSQEQQDFFDEMSAKFEADNPDIDIEWTTSVDSQYRESLPLALRSEMGPDIFWTFPEDDLSRFVQQGWIQPIGDYIDQEMLAQFNPSVMGEGSMYFDGQLYTLPYYNRFVMLNGIMFYNKTVFEKAGLDPETSVPQTFSELLSVTKQITEAGNGEYYGIVWAGNPAQEMHRILNGLLSTATPASGDIRFGRPGFDYRDGSFKSANENHNEVFSVLKAMVDNGSIVPGWSSMDKGTARSLFGQNKVAIYFDGEWMKRVWASMGYEDLDLGVAQAPVPDSGRRTFRQMTAAHGDVVLSAFARDTEKSARVYKWLHSVEFQSELLKRGYAFPGNTSVDYDSIIQDQYRKDILSIANNNVIVHPEPKLSNEGAAAVQWPDVHPNINEVMASALTGDVDYSEEAAKLDAEMMKQLKRNIERARSEGATVSLEDFIFPDWDPMSDYME